MNYKNYFYTALMATTLNYSQPINIEAKSDLPAVSLEQKINDKSSDGTKNDNRKGDNHSFLIPLMLCGGAFMFVAYQMEKHDYPNGDGMP